MNTPRNPTRFGSGTVASRSWRAVGKLCYPIFRPSPSYVRSGVGGAALLFAVLYAANLLAWWIGKML